MQWMKSFKQLLDQLVQLPFHQGGDTAGNKVVLLNSRIQNYTIDSSVTDAVVPQHLSLVIIWNGKALCFDQVPQQTQLLWILC